MKAGKQLVGRAAPFHGARCQRTEERRAVPRAPPPRLQRGEPVGQREEVAGPRRKSRVKGQVSERPEGTAKEGRGKKHFGWKRRGVRLEKDAPW